MSLVPSLCAALESAGGERLVMRAGERPHVLAGQRRHDVASAILSINAVEALAEQILSPVARQELTAQGSTSEPVSSPSFPHPLTARAERVGDDFCIELIVSMPMEPPLAPAQPETGDIAPVEPVVSLETPKQAEINGIEAPMSIEQPAITAAPEPGSVSVYRPEPAPTHVPEIVAESALDHISIAPTVVHRRDRHAGADSSFPANRHVERCLGPVCLDRSRGESWRDDALPEIRISSCRSNRRTNPAHRSGHAVAGRARERDGKIYARRRGSLGAAWGR